MQRIFPSYPRTTRIFSRGFRVASSLNQRKEIAFLLDMDGVLLRGSKALPPAKPALELLNRYNVPFVLLTNGGGITEADRAKKLSSLLDLPISPLQVVQSHTPIKALAINNTYERVMVVGGQEDKARKCALEYGFKEVLMPIDIVKAYPASSPYSRYTREELDKFALDPVESHLEKPIDAIFVFNDTREANSDIQLIMDLLNSQNGVVGTSRVLKEVKDRQEPSIPIIFSNNDFVWATDYNLPRFGQGALRIITEALYKEANQLSSKENLKSILMGKPFAIQYDFAHHVLIDWRDKILLKRTHDTQQYLPPLNTKPELSPFNNVYMVGDNPASDIAGANINGWDSLLVRTGVYKDDDWETAVAHPTCGVHDDILEAVKYVLSYNKVL